MLGQRSRFPTAHDFCSSGIVELVHCTAFRLCDDDIDFATGRFCLRSLLDAATIFFLQVSEPQIPQPCPSRALGSLDEKNRESLQSHRFPEIRAHETLFQTGSS